jgi:hypothetical protein
MWADRPRFIQWGPKCGHFGLVLYFCTADRSGLEAGPSAVLTREDCFCTVPVLLCGLSDQGQRTISECQINLGRDCMFLGVYTMDCPVLYGGQSVCVNPSWSELWCSKLPGLGRYGQDWRTVRTSLF